jgi:hypothetical protein
VNSGPNSLTTMLPDQRRNVERLNDKRLNVKRLNVKLLKKPWNVKQPNVKLFECRTKIELTTPN